MDRPLEDMISERQQQRPRPRGRRPPRNDSGKSRPNPKSSHRDDSRDLDKDDWVHDRYEDDRYEESSSARRDSRGARGRRNDYSGRPERNESAIPPNGAQLRVDNLHYDLTEPDLRELFTRIGPVHTVSILYDRSDRSRGTAFVTYLSARDAEDAIKEFDGANAYGQPIKLTLIPSGPATKGLDSRIEGPGRSLFDRVQNDRAATSGRRGRSESPRDRRSEVLREGTPDGIDRYVPGQSSRPPRSRSPTPPRNSRPPKTDATSRSRRDDRRGGARGRGGSTRGQSSRAAGGPRPRKTAQELDAEMEDYWGADNSLGASLTSNNETTMTGPNGGNTANLANPDEDIDMIE